MQPSPEILVFLLISLLLVVAMMLALIFHKARRIHLAMYQLQADASYTKLETERLFGQLQALFALERLLDLPRALPAMRGWAGSPDFLLRTAEEILSRRPKIILECSSGVSTLVAARVLQITGGGHVFSLEHDPAYAEKTRSLLRLYGLGDWATVLNAPLVANKKSPTPWYSLEALSADISNIEILVVDGPPKETGPLARYPALPNLECKLAPNALIIVDDAARDDEQVMLARWQREFPAFKQTDAYCEKGCTLVERIKPHTTKIE